ncbi:hypothetical protein V7S43_018194 [Phytophthora oleae]|uniref:CCZ1/INTU/HSP4 first Longin domain-containing protein n=1 Tax=Phytophthora oleae TaxID=2107226 RepID=A0ABD3ERP2_9STRA
MEGVVLVEMSSGALHYTKSFSNRFDVHHPKSKRLNLGALIFALQNFAGSSIREKDHNEGSGAVTGLQASRAAEIAMYSTPLENMVLVTTPSNKLLVGLFTTPEFDAEVAKWIVRRLAFNYENCDSTEMELLNQVSRRFRLAFSQSVDDAVEMELIHLSETILIPLEGELETGKDNTDSEELFLFFYYSTRLDDSTPEGSNDITIQGKAVSAADREEKYCNAVKTANPTISDISQHSATNFSIRNIVSSTRAIITKKNIRWRPRNAVVDHSEPHEFQRVVEINERKAVLMEPHRTGSAYGIAGILLPFVEVSRLPDWTIRPNSTLAKLKSQKLNQTVWENIPGSTLGNGKRQGTNIIAWRSGPCCIFYPITARCTDPGCKPRVRHAVSALFNVLESLLKAKALV